MTGAHFWRASPRLQFQPEYPSRSKCVILTAVRVRSSYSHGREMRDTLSLERKLEMHEAREAILNRIGSETFSVINLDHFLQATVTEVGKMMGVDRCDVMTLTPDNQLRITHE